MNVDWTVAIGVFMIFVIWSLVYYTGFLDERTGISQSTETVAARIVDFLDTEVYTMPASYDSPGPGQAVLYAEISVPPGSGQGLMVREGGSSLDCMLQGRRLYWDSYLAEGANLFEISYSDTDTGGCNDAIQAAGANQTFPLAAVKTKEISQSALSALQDVPYQEFRESLGIHSNVMIEWSGPIQGTYGPAPPGNRDVSISETSRPLLESGQLGIRISFWE
jgi:hypothetical protein